MTIKMFAMCNILHLSVKHNTEVKKDFFNSPMQANRVHVQAINNNRLTQFKYYSFGINIEL